MHVLLAIFAALVVAVFHAVDPLDLHATSSVDAAMAGLQTLAITLPVAVWVSPIKGETRWRGRIAVITCIVLPCLIAIDAVAYRWIGQHLPSWAMLRVVTDLRGGLIQHASPGSAFGISIVIAGCAAYASVVLLMTWIIPKRNFVPKRVAWLAVLVTWIIVGTSAAKSHERATLVTTQLATPTQTPTSDFESAVTRRELRQRALTVVTSDATSDRTGAKKPDVLIVVVESFRHELISPDGTPNLWRLAHQGIGCRQHYSGGNATNHGVFSLVNGLEAIWYPRPIRFSPTLNRLFRFAGYEVGFFGGHDDWQTFHMDGFIGPDHFDKFEVEPPDGLASDRRAAERANRFLNADRDQRKPRLALLYLYATHATYDSYPEDRKFEPAADDRFLIPYIESAREGVWNRYRNAGVTVDRFIGAITKNEDLVVVVTGDHGESFLEDGTIGHGTKLSPQQNMTPAIIRIPGVNHRLIDQPTMHADVLPTLLAAAGIELSDADALDGIDLASATDEELQQRVFVTRNYFDDDVAIVGGDAPMQTGASVSLSNFSASGSGPLWQRWLSFRFDTEVADRSQGR